MCCAQPDVYDTANDGRGVLDVKNAESDDRYQIFRAAADAA